MSSDWIQAGCIHQYALDKVPQSLFQSQAFVSVWKTPIFAALSTLTATRACNTFIGGYIYKTRYLYHRCVCPDDLSWIWR
ncbi:hypothetical protein LX36DRAFT_652434 [Colletotrichum falcatum]|nr:hypothetical protein LX36DRAFT_652434 [Colletotrichum falcatum]